MPYRLICDYKYRYTFSLAQSELAFFKTTIVLELLKRHIRDLYGVPYVSYRSYVPLRYGMITITIRDGAFRVFSTIFSFTSAITNFYLIFIILIVKSYHICILFYLNCFLILHILNRML